MKRSKEIILVSHCILNANSKVEGLSEYSGMVKELVSLIFERGAGLVQLPCPEMHVYGIRRWGHVKEQFDTPHFRQESRKILSPLVDQVEDYIKNGYRVLAVIGIDGSPSCGVFKTCSGNWRGELSTSEGLEDMLSHVSLIEEPGVFMEELQNLFINRKLDIPFIALDEMNMSSGMEKIQSILRS